MSEGVVVPPGAGGPGRAAGDPAAPGVAHRPDPLGHFGPWGGRFVPEVLMAALDQLTDAFEEAIADPGFVAELEALRCKEEGRSETIVFNLCGHGHFDLKAYEDHLSGNLLDV